MTAMTGSGPTARTAWEAAIAATKALPAQALRLQVEEDPETVVEVGDPEQVHGPGGVDDRRVGAVLDQDDGRQHHLGRAEHADRAWVEADDEVEWGRTARRDHPQGDKTVDEQRHSDQEQTDVAHTITAPAGR